MATVDIAETAEEISLSKKYADYISEFLGTNPDLLSQLEESEGSIKAKLFEDIKSYNEFLKAHFGQDLQMALNLYFAIVFARQCKDNYLSKGIDSTIYRDTMSDINIWVDSYHAETGEIGLREIHWIRKHLAFKIFRLGRLQFEMTTLTEDVKGYAKNTDCLSIHIPEGESLDTSKCQQSLEMARPFFNQYFDIDYRLAVCYSWLLHENLKVILDQNSNIVKFAQLFEVVRNTDDCSQALERVFGTGTAISPDMPENTSLQKKMKEFLLAGNVIGEGFGIIEL